MNGVVVFVSIALTVSLSACSSSVAPADGGPSDALRDGADDGPLECTLPNGAVCAVGSVCQTGDGCTTCICNADRTLACTNLGCVDAGGVDSGSTITFTCGTTPCVPWSEYCQITIGGVTDIPRYSCEPLPACEMSSCTCIRGAGRCADMCTSGAAGEFTVTCAVP